MKKRYLIIFCIIFLITILLSQKSKVTYDNERQLLGEERSLLVKILQSKIKEIQDKNPMISKYILQQDIEFIKINFEKSWVAAMANLSFISKICIIIDAWIDLRVRKIIEPEIPLVSFYQMNRYGGLSVYSKPCDGATIIVDDKDTEKKTNSTLGLPKGEYLVKVKLNGYKSRPKEKKLIIYENKHISVEFQLIDINNED